MMKVANKGWQQPGNFYDNVCFKQGK